MSPLSHVPKPAPAAKPRSRGGQGFFAPVEKDFWKRLSEEGCDFSEIAYFAMILTSKATTPLGSLYIQHEWADIPGTHPAHMEKAIEGLERRGKVIRDGYYLLVRSFLRHNCFRNPKYLRASLYSLQNEVDSPLLRFVVGTELMRLDLADRERKHAENMHEAASVLWAELTETALPPIAHMTGNLDQPNLLMIQSLLHMPHAEQAIEALEAKQWLPIKEQLRGPIQEMLGAQRPVVPLNRLG